MRRVFLALLLSIPHTALFAADDVECRPIPSSFRLRGVPKPPEVVEAESLAEMAKEPGRLPQVPFGFSNKSWNEFKAEMQEGDLLVAYIGNALGGHVLLRRGCFVGVFNTMVIG